MNEATNTQVKTLMMMVLCQGSDRRRRRQKGSTARAPPARRAARLAAALDTAGYAELLQPLLGEDQPPILLGHSFGGRIAVQMARRWPARVAGLVLTGVPLLRAELGGSGGKPKPGYRIGRFLHRHGLLTEQAMGRLREKYGSADYRQMQQPVFQLFVPDLT